VSPIPATTQTDATLVLKIGTSNYGAQVINAEFTPPWAGDGDTVITADGSVVKEPAAQQEDGKITGEVYKATGTTGITRVLMQNIGQTLAYEYTENAGVAGKEMKFTGNCVVRPPSVGFNPNKYGRHGLELTVLTATLAAAI
jgi:hypothetical protein